MMRINRISTNSSSSAGGNVDWQHTAATVPNYVDNLASKLKDGSIDSDYSDVQIQNALSGMRQLEQGNCKR
jgi:hypothetical protein